MTATIDRSERYRLIPSRGRLLPTVEGQPRRRDYPKSWYVYGADEARAAAEESYKQTGIPVLVCRFPPGGTCDAQYMIPIRKRTRSKV